MKIQTLSEWLKSLGERKVRDGNGVSGHANLWLEALEIVNPQLMECVYLVDDERATFIDGYGQSISINDPMLMMVVEDAEAAR